MRLTFRLAYAWIGWSGLCFILRWAWEVKWVDTHWMSIFYVCDTTYFLIHGKVYNLTYKSLCTCKKILKNKKNVARPNLANIKVYTFVYNVVLVKNIKKNTDSFKGQHFCTKFLFNLILTNLRSKMFFHK